MADAIPLQPDGVNTVVDGNKTILSRRYPGDIHSRFRLAANGAVSRGDGANAPALYRPENWTEVLDDGNQVFPARGITLSNAVSTTPTQRLHLIWFTTSKGGSNTGITLFSGAVAASATPTLIRAGLYSIGATTLTQIAEFASDTALFAATATAYPKTWTTPVTLAEGTRYVMGLLVITAGTVPQLVGNSLGGTSLSSEAAKEPRKAGFLAAQADLPASVTISGISGASVQPYFNLAMA